MYAWFTSHEREVENVNYDSCAAWMKVWKYVLTIRTIPKEGRQRVPLVVYRTNQELGMCAPPRIRSRNLRKSQLVYGSYYWFVQVLNMSRITMLPVRTVKTLIVVDEISHVASQLPFSEIALQTSKYSESRYRSLESNCCLLQSSKMVYSLERNMCPPEFSYTVCPRAMLTR